MTTIKLKFKIYLEDKKMIIGNPPYKLATEFVEHSLDLLDDGEYACYLLKMQIHAVRQTINMTDMPLQ